MDTRTAQDLRVGVRAFFGPSDRTSEIRLTGNDGVT